MRFRIPELLEESRLTPRGLVERSEGRISRATAYRLVRLKGRLRTFDAGLSEVLCEVLRLRDPGRLFELEGAPKAKRAKRGGRRPAAPTSDRSRETALRARTLKQMFAKPHA